MGNDDFDPFDLSAPPRVINDPKTLMADFTPKPTVRRVSMGPIFHSRILKIIALILGIILFALSGYIGMNYYLTKKQTTVDNNNKTNEIINASNSSNQNNANKKQDPSVSTPTPNLTPKAGIDPSTNATTPSTTKVYCGVIGMPEGICTIINSVEKEGLKNNKYVTADTSQIPNGTKVEVDENTWNQSGPEIGSVNFSAKINNVNYTGTAYAQIVNGTWKVISYNLNQ